MSILEASRCIEESARGWNQVPLFRLSFRRVVFLVGFVQITNGLLYGVAGGCRTKLLRAIDIRHFH